MLQLQLPIYMDVGDQKFISRSSDGFGRGFFPALSAPTFPILTKDAADLDSCRWEAFLSFPSPPVSDFVFSKDCKIIEEELLRRRTSEECTYQ